MKTIIGHLLPSLILAAVLLAPSPVEACSVCMGGADTPVAPAMNGAIFLMLGFVGLMLSSAAGFIVYLVRRAKTPLGPNAEITRLLSTVQEEN